jgi:hypothetical protein
MRSLLLYAAASAAALGLVGATASNAKAQWLPRRVVTTTYIPTTAYYEPAPVVVTTPPPVYLTPAPVTTTYYSPVTYSSYYAPVATVPAPVVAAPFVAAPVVTAYRPAWIFRPRVVYRY